MRKDGKYEAVFRVIGSEDGTTLVGSRHQGPSSAPWQGQLDKWVLQTRVPLPVDTDTDVAKVGLVIVVVHEAYSLRP